MPDTNRPEAAAEPQHGRRRRRWWRIAIPAVLVVVALGAGATAVVLDQREPAAPEGDPTGPRLATPILSVRRLPTVLAAPVAERRLRSDLGGLLDALPADSCITVHGREGAVLFDHQGDRPLRPGSNEKLLTAAAALEVLGGDTRFRTTAVTAAPVVGGRLQGDLVLVGGGDPVLATADYAARYRNQPQVLTDIDQLAASVRAAGITHIAGSVRGDESRYDRLRFVPGWPQRYLDAHEVGPLSALSVDDAFSEYPEHGGSNSPAVPAADPATQAATVLTERLAAHGVAVDGPAASGAKPAGAKVVASLDSPPLRDIVAGMLRESDDQIAELLLKELGHTVGHGSTAGGAAVVAATLKRPAPADGSGLSLDDRATCDELLALFDRPTTGAAIDRSLAVAGKTGTLRFRFLGTPLVGKVRAKTGSLTSVRSLTGVVEDDDGVLRFSSIVTVPAGQAVPKDVDAAQQRLVQILLDYPRVADEAALEPLPPVDG